MKHSGYKLAMGVNAPIDVFLISWVAGDHGKQGQTQELHYTAGFLRFGCLIFNEKIGQQISFISYVRILLLNPSGIFGVRLRSLHEFRVAQSERIQLRWFGSFQVRSLNHSFIAYVAGAVIHAACARRCVATHSSAAIGHAMPPRRSSSAKIQQSR